MPGMENYRDDLDALDREIITKLAARKDLVSQVIRHKDETGADLRDKKREEELLLRLIQQGKDLGLDGYFVSRLFHEILDYSLRVQKDHLIDTQGGMRSGVLSIGYMGIEGAYSYFAARNHFASRTDDAAFRGFNTFRELVEHVERGDVDYGVLPVENTTAGSINDAYDLLNDKSVSAVGEELQRIDHCLMALEDVPLNRIHRIYSHPQALAQCDNFLSSLENCHVESYADTASAAQKVIEDQDLSQAAIAGEEAAKHYGLSIIRRNIANRRDNFTRFMIIAKEPAEFDERIPCKTSIIVATAHHKGALLGCLNVLAAHDLNMVKLESRPRPNVPWEYLFYIDFEGNQRTEDVRQALSELTRETAYLKVLGSYPARTLEDNRPVDVSMLGKKGGASTAAKRSSRARQPSSGAAAKSQKEEILRLLEGKPFKLASRLHRERDTVIRVKNAILGGDQFTVIAGPCSVESREQVLETARVCKDNGAHVLRGGVFKPRTSPYSFQGLGLQGLEYLVEAGRMYDLPVVTEVMHPHDVAPVAADADILQIGTRNMQNFALLKAVGKVDRPVLLKRGMMSSIEEWLSAAEYILAQGNQQVILCERGIRTFETATRNTFDISAIPVLREWTHLPVIADPAHAVGVWRWIPPLCHASLAVGAQGIMIEVHNHPDEALSDGPQALKYDTFARLMHDLHARQPADREL